MPQVSASFVLKKQIISEMRRGGVMKRHTFAMEIKQGKVADFRRNLGEIWPEFVGFLEQHKMKNFSIWSVERIVFGYYETETNFDVTQEDKNQFALWKKQYGDSYNWISVPFEDMRLMYHDYGIVRENKELIRHRVFITKLKTGMEQEYKDRHDALIDARGDKITKGPDSNFSIWYAGGYIFGYNEIDTTMEHEMTTEEKENTIRWENWMLQIMDWITNDVDWITGECHASIQRLGWHK